MRKKILVLTPLFGILLFSILYVVATFYYSGGSQADKSTKGFDWLNNYWCDLTDQLAMNGETNSARPIALTAILILLSTLAIFWYYLPHIFQNSKYSQIIRYAGITSMTVSIFVFTRSHVTALNIAGIFGIIALIACKSLYSSLNAPSSVPNFVLK